MTQRRPSTRLYDAGVSPTGVACTFDCPGYIVYNGNYFCDYCDWSAGQDFLVKWPEAYAGLMDRRARKQKTHVTKLINFNQTLYSKGKARLDAQVRS